MVRQVVCFGEALIDFINTEHRVEAGLLLNSFTQYPGGAPANAAVAVAKLGGNASFAGQVGDDSFGRFLVDALKLYGVETAFTSVHPTAKTALAFVFLDAQGERSFSFRREGTADVVIRKDQIGDNWFSDGSIVHVCSNTLTDPSIADVTEYVVSQARAQNSIVSFDVNLRHNLWNTGRADIDTVTNIVRRSNIVKASLDEIDYLSQKDREGYLDQCFTAGVTAVLVTDGPGEMFIHTANSRFSFKPPNVNAVDTTGGGDAFIGAVLYGLSRQVDPLAIFFNEGRLKSLMSFAAQCGAFAVARHGAFPSFPVFDDVKQHWGFGE